jgi:RES domain-containing protein
MLRQLFANSPLDGEGAYQFGGRWSSPGTRVAYASEHLSLAMIEYFMPTDPANAPSDLVVVAAEVPDQVSRVVLTPDKLPPDWRQLPAPPSLAAIGDAFVGERKSAILRVPSVLAPAESNWLINPRHPESMGIRVRPPEPFHYDARFLA